MASEGRFLVDGGKFYVDDLPYCEVLEAVGVTPAMHAERRKLLRATSVIDAANKGPWLLRWQLATAIEHYRLNAQRFEAMEEKPMLDECLEQSDQIRDMKADRGTIFHELMEKLVWGKKIPRQLQQLYPQFPQILAFLEEWQPEPVATEFIVVDPHLGTAGTCDLYARIRGLGVCVADYKTSRRVAEQAALLQETFYDRGSYRIVALGSNRWKRELPLPRAESLVVLHFPDADGYAVHTLDPTGVHRDLAWEAFKGLVPQARLLALPRGEKISKKLKPGYEAPVPQMRGHILQRLAWMLANTPDGLDMVAERWPDEIPDDPAEMDVEQLIVIMELVTVVEAALSTPFGPQPSNDVRRLREQLVG